MKRDPRPFAPENLDYGTVRVNQLVGGRSGDDSAAVVATSKVAACSMSNVATTVAAVEVAGDSAIRVTVSKYDPGSAHFGTIQDICSDNSLGYQIGKSVHSSIDSANSEGEKYLIETTITKASYSTEIPFHTPTFMTPDYTPTAFSNVHQLQPHILPLPSSSPPPKYIHPVKSTPTAWPTNSPTSEQSYNPPHLLRQYYMKAKIIAVTGIRAACMAARIKEDSYTVSVDWVLNDPKRSYIMTENSRPTDIIFISHVYQLLSQDLELLAASLGITTTVTLGFSFTPHKDMSGKEMACYITVSPAAQIGGEKESNGISDAEFSESSSSDESEGFRKYTVVEASDDSDREYQSGSDFSNEPFELVKKKSVS